jgi:hypothetical protein
LWERDEYWYLLMHLFSPDFFSIFYARKIRRAGEIDKKRLLSPALSSFFEEERERKCGGALKANLLENTTGQESGITARVRQS